MRFASSHFFWMLTLIPLLLVFYVWAFKRKAHLLHQFVSRELQDRLLIGFSYTRQKIKVAMLLGVVLFCSIALVRPQWGFHWEEVKRKGVDIMIALDVSRSMLAEDVSPNRLQRAKREIIDLINILEGDRVGLVAFAGTSFLQVPLTLDYGAVRLFLDDVDTDLIPIPGTAIGDAITKSIKSFDKDDRKSRVVILITDGEDHEGGPLEAATEAQKEGVKIYTIGIGQKSGAPISAGTEGGFKKNSQGEVVLSKIDEETLQRIANQTGGRYVHASTGNMNLEKIYNDIRQTVEDKELKSGRRQRFEERYQWPLMIAILLLLLEGFLSERRRHREEKDENNSNNNNGVLLSLIICFMFGLTVSIPHQSFAWGFQDKERKAETAYEQKKYNEALQGFIDKQVEDPHNERLKYNLANTYYQAKDYEKAGQLYNSLIAESGDSKMRQKAYYNLGNTLFQAGKLQESVASYKEALKLDPNDQDAQNNLKFVLDEIKRRIEEQKKRQEQQKQQQQNQQQDNKNQDQQNQDQQKQDQQKQDQQKQDQQKQEEKKEQDKKEQQQGQQGQQGQEKDKEDKEDKQQAQQQQQAEAAKEGGGEKDKDKKEMTPEEARRWLSTLDENRKKYLKKQQEQQIPNGQRYRVEKDW